MSLSAIEEILTEPFKDDMANRTLQKAISLGLIEKWVPRNRYAKHYGVTPQTIYNRTPYLRRIGVADGTGKATRYDITVTPNGKRLMPKLKK